MERHIRKIPDKLQWCWQTNTWRESTHVHVSTAIKTYLGLSTRSLAGQGQPTHMQCTGIVMVQPCLPAMSFSLRSTRSRILQLLTSLSFCRERNQSCLGNLGSEFSSAFLSSSFFLQGNVYCKGSFFSSKNPAHPCPTNTKKTSCEQCRSEMMTLEAQPQRPTDPARLRRCQRRADERPQHKTCRRAAAKTTAASLCRRCTSQRHS